MIDEIYEVERDEFVGFLKQLKKDCVCITSDNYGQINQLLYTSIDKERIFAALVNNTNDDSYKYYVIDMPLPEERIAAKPIRKITLETQEEVQAFFDILNSLKEKKND